MTKTRGQKADRGHSQSQGGGDGEEPGLGRRRGDRATPRKLTRGGVWLPNTRWGLPEEAEEQLAD